MNKTDNLMITAGVVSAMAGSEYSTPMLKMRSNRRSMGQQVRCHICGKARVTLCKDDSNPGKYICKACKDSLMQAIPKAVLKEACNKIKEEGLYNEL
ncbi:hypothetical protein [Acutalibacter sp. JLR.KK004]|uniref:hypothetical protein n=1 Tax=Acutalibacter sp. JLR.KK004 TaxID=3112622 RepID=UPI002FF111AF